MLLELPAAFEANALRLQNEVDWTQRGVLSCFDREKNEMLISHDYYSWQSGPACYQKQQKVKDPFSRLHWLLYQELPQANSIAVFRSHHTMLWAQLGEGIPPLGAWHAEHFYGEIPCTAPLKKTQMTLNAQALAQTVTAALGRKSLAEMPAVLLKDFGVFAASPTDAVDTAESLEKIAELAWQMKTACGRALEYMDYASMNRFHTALSGKTGAYLQKMEDV